MTCKTLGEAAAPTIAAAIDSVHRAKVAALLADASFATARHDAASLSLIADKLKLRAAVWVADQAGLAETVLREAGG